MKLSLTMDELSAYILLGFVILCCVGFVASLISEDSNEEENDLFI